jgi:RimJ/RimL family protein N-acetyltransferase
MPLRSVVAAIAFYGIQGCTSMASFLVPQPDSLHDDVVTLRPWHVDFAPALAKRINDQAVAEFMDTVPQPYSLSDAHDFIARSREGWLSGTLTNFAILVEGIDGAAGGVGVHWNERDHGIAEVGYWVAADARRRGVATTATRLAAGWAFAAAPDLERLRADEQNAASNGVAAKAGFTREGVLRSSRYNVRLERRVDFVMWSLLRGELSA